MYIKFQTSVKIHFNNMYVYRHLIRHKIKIKQLLIIIMFQIIKNLQADFIYLLLN